MQVLDSRRSEVSPPVITQPNDGWVNVFDLDVPFDDENPF